MLHLNIATLRATFIIKRAMRIGGAVLSAEFGRAVQVLIRAGMHVRQAVQFAMNVRRYPDVRLSAYYSSI